MTHRLSMWAKEGNRIIAYDENYNPPARHSIALLYGPDQDINGALIAATLELLEACKCGHGASEGWLWDILTILQNNDRGLAELFRRKMQLEVAAIGKAEGEQ